MAAHCRHEGAVEIVYGRSVGRGRQDQDRQQNYCPAHRAKTPRRAAMVCSG
jgi:hypothetical protein